MNTEQFARVRSALGASGQQEARGLAALREIEEQLEALRDAAQRVDDLGEAGMYRSRAMHSPGREFHNLHMVLMRGSQSASRADGRRSFASDLPAARETFPVVMNNTASGNPCPKGRNCALNKGAVSCKHCGRNWPPDKTWEASSPAKSPNL